MTLARNGGIVGRVGGRLRETVEEWTGVTVADRAELGGLRESAVQLEMWREEAMELAYWAMDYFSGRPQEMRPERRNRLAQRSRIALMQDPLAGAEAQLLANFAFGRGIGRPQAAHPAVQAVIDEAWENPVNKEKLCSYEAQRHRSNEMITQANLYPVAFVRNGKVRVGFLDADQVPHIVCDPEDDERPLWYVTRRYQVGWDFTSDRPIPPHQMKGGTGTYLTPQIIYYPHWQNVTDAMRERAANEEDAIEMPPKDKIGGGFVAHFRINRIGRTQFGTPPWARTLRFYSAMNSLTEAHVAMAQARSSFIAKRVSKGTPEQIQRAAASLLSLNGEIGATRFGENPAWFDGPTGLGGGFGPSAGPLGMDPRFSSPMPGSIVHENEASTLTSLNLSSGASEAEQTAQIVRAPIAGSAQFGQHYFGDASNGNLASNTSLELPALMNVQAWQQTFEEVLRWFTDMVIEAAVRNGDLGGAVAPDDEDDEVRFELPDKTDPSIAEDQLREWEEQTYRRMRLRLQESDKKSKPLHELRLREDQAEIERRTGIDLSYTFEMPYPGRRNLPDVLAAVNTVVLSYDPMGQNIPLRRALLLFLASQGLQVDDPAKWVDEVLPKNTKPAPIMPGGAPGVAAQALAPELRPERAEGNPRQDASQTFNSLGRVSPNDEMGEAIMHALGGQLGVERLRESIAMQRVGASLGRLTENRWEQADVDQMVESLLVGTGSNGNGNGSSGGDGE
jgi:hypothetical protein